ncbi:serine hydrolase domain-containing protein [Sphingobacterium sp. Lzh-3]|uniref:serine hydrolase domain-containing protein n=1 Tax=Sphingobacterium sp. Lzh-3 TaxID=3382150 RepID=UPI00398CB248
MRFILFSVFIFLNTRVVTAQTVQERLDSLFQSLNTDGELSGAFLIVDSGQVVFEKYLGFQDASKTKRITSNSRFELASVSKQFTAMAIMQLEEQGKISYDDDIVKYFPRLKFKNVRVKNLLRHTSGIPDFFSFPEKWVDTKKINKNSDILKILEEHVDSVLFKPGEQCSYSNTNYLLLALIVEKVSGQPFAVYMQKFIFKPAEMRNTSVFSAHSPHADLKNYAKGITYNIQNKNFINVDDFETYKYATYFDGVSGPYGISSTAEDLLKWDRALQNFTLLKRDNFIKAISSDTLNNGKLISRHHMYEGLGWVFMDSTNNENKMHFHTGGYPGYQTILVRNPENQWYFVALINKSNTIGVFPLTMAVAAILEKNEALPLVEREKLTGALTLVEFQIKQLLGTYEYTKQPELKFKITVDDKGSLFAQLSGQSAIEVYPKNELELFYTEVKAELKFLKENDQILSVTLYQNGRELTFNKVK